MRVARKPRVPVSDSIRPQYRPPATRVAPKPKPRRGRAEFVALAIVLVVGGYGAHRSLSPHIGRATKAEILAVLPPDIVAPEPRDEAAEARFTQIDGLVRKELPESLRSDPARQSEVDRRIAELTPRLKRILEEGPVQAPPMNPSLGAPGALDSTRWSDAFPRNEIVLAAAKRGDRHFCVEDALWRLRLTEAYENAGFKDGANWAGSVAELIYRVEMLDGYGPEGRARILRLLPARDGRNPAEARRLRRWARELLLPQIVAIGGGSEPWSQPQFMEIAPTVKSLPPSGHPRPPGVAGGSAPVGDGTPKWVPAEKVGTFDPVETARLMGEYVQALIDDQERPFSERTNRAGEIQLQESMRISEVREGHRPGMGEEGFFDNLAWRDGMNRGRNTLGERLSLAIHSMSFEQIDASRCNLVRAVLLLRSGATALPPDPYGRGPLKFDPKRRLVWSVSGNGIDDGAKEVKRFSMGAMGLADPPEDIVYRY